MHRRSLAQAEPRSQYIQRDYMNDWSNEQIKQKIPLTTQFRRWKERQPSRNPCRFLSLFLVPHSCWFWKLVVTWGMAFTASVLIYDFLIWQKRGYPSLRPKLLWPWGTSYNSQFSNNWPEEFSAAGKHEVTNDDSRPSWILRFYNSASEKSLLYPNI